MRKITQAGGDDIACHRADFITCPSCDSRFETGAWDSAATTLVLNPKIHKSGAIAIVSECPKCLSDSWVHHRIDGFSYADWPKSWKTAGEAFGLTQTLRHARMGRIHLPQVQAPKIRNRRLQNVADLHSRIRSQEVSAGPFRVDWEKIARPEPIMSLIFHR